MTTHPDPETATAHAWDLLEESTEAEAIDRHLEACTDCADRIARLKTGRIALASALAQPTLPTPAWRAQPWMPALAATFLLCMLGFFLLVPPPREDRLPATPQDAAEWIDDLSSDDPLTRERALRELTTLGDKVEPALREALAKTTDAEARAHLTSLLDHLEFSRLDFIAMAGPEGTILLTTPDGARQRTLGKPGPPATMLSWSPNRQWLTYLRVSPKLSSPWSLYLLDVTSGAEHKALSKAQLAHACWSPDSRAFLAVDRGDCICKINVADPPGSRTELQIGQSPFLWLPDGSFYLFYGGELERWSPSSGTVESVTSGIGPAAAQPDGGSIFFFGPADGQRGYGLKTHPLLCLETTSGTLRLIRPGVALDTNSSLALSPDGHRLALVRLDDEHPLLTLIDIASGTEQSIGPGKGPTWSPDGSLLAYERPDGKTIVMNIATGAETTLLGSAPAWSPPRKR